MGYKYADKEKFSQDRLEFLKSRNKRRLGKNDPVRMQPKPNHWLYVKQASWGVFVDMSVEPFHLLILNLGRIFVESWLKKLQPLTKFELNNRLLKLKNTHGFQKLMPIDTVAQWRGDEVVIFLLLVRFTQLENLFPAVAKDLQLLMHLFLKFFEEVTLPFTNEDIINTGAKLYSKFLRKFKKVIVEDNEKEYESKVTFHQTWHLFDVYKEFGPSQLIWAKPFERDIGEIKSGNVSGANGLIAMTNSKNLKKSLELRVGQSTIGEEEIPSAKSKKQKATLNQIVACYYSSTRKGELKYGIRINNNEDNSSKIVVQEVKKVAIIKTLLSIVSNNNQQKRIRKTWRKGKSSTNVF